MMMLHVGQKLRPLECTSRQTSAHTSINVSGAADVTGRYGCIVAVQACHHGKHMISITHIARHVTLAQTATMLTSLLFSAS